MMDRNKSTEECVVEYMGDRQLMSAAGHLRQLSVPVPIGRKRTQRREGAGIRERYAIVS